MSASKLMTLGFVILLVSLGWFFRHAPIAANVGGEGTHGAVYLVNRWTGSVQIVTPSGTRVLEEK